MSRIGVMLVDIACAMLAMFMVGCGATPFSDRRQFPGHLVEDRSRDAYAQPRRDLDAHQQALFLKGKAEFEQTWVPFPSIGGQWGRGPLFNAESCAECHARNGRGNIQASDEDGLVSLLMRLGSAASEGSDPGYGRQLNTRGILGRVPAEGRPQVQWQEYTVALQDGTNVALRAPRPMLQDLAYGPLSADTRLSLRIAPQLVGLGLLGRVAESELQRVRSAQRRLGYEGHINHVWNRESGTWDIGRFGWKASQATLKQQIAQALIDDIGVTSSLFMKDNCTERQLECQRTPTVIHPEAKDELLQAIGAYLQNLAVPAPRVSAGRGSQLFSAMHCDQCHVPRLYVDTSPTVTMHAYTDLMLHDMGPALADEVAEFDARGYEWRTPPLWGLGLLETVSGSVRLLHDGRARTIEEAILWHDGQAARSKAAYARSSRDERASLLQFLQSL